MIIKSEKDDIKMNPEKVDLLILNGLILTLDPGRELIANGYLSIKDGLIQDLGFMSDLKEKQFLAHRTISAKGGLVMPGLINGHTHAAMTCFRGMADDLPLMTWLNEHIFPAEAAFLDPEFSYWGTKLAMAEMIMSGTTTFVDGYFLEIDVFRAVKESGMRAILGQGVIDFPAPGVPDPTKNVEKARDFIEQTAGISDLIQPSVFCHSSLTCSSETLTRAKDLAKEKNCFFQIHLAETKDEVNEINEKYRVSPVRHLDALGLLDENTLVIHAVHLTDEDIDILADREVPVVSCPESNMKLGAGISPLSKMLDKGIKVALGTDGAASNNDLNLFGEMQMIALNQKYSTLDPTKLPAKEAVQMATSLGSKAIHLSSRTGRLIPGLEGDIIILDFEEPNLIPMYNPYSHLAYAVSGHEVNTVIVKGRVLLEEGRLETIDLNETFRKVREIANKIMSGK